MSEVTRAQALEALTLMPAEVGRLCGFDRLGTMHNRWIRQMLLTSSDMTLLAHRGSYKTTCLSVALAILLVIEPEKKLLFLRKTDGDVAEVLRQVASIVRAPAFQALGGAVWGCAPEVARLTQGGLTLSTHLSQRGAQQLTAQGIGGSLTGKHADILITDDIVNLQDRLSPAERQRTRQVYMELQNIRNPGGRIINTGTPWHPEDAVSLMPNQVRWDCYTTGLLTADEIAGLRRSMLPSLFAANYELKLIASEEALFSFTPPEEKDNSLLWGGAAHLDAAYGGGDCTALTCAKAAGGRVLLYGRLWPGHVDSHLTDIVAECGRLRCAPLYLEVNADKGYLAKVLRARGLAVHPYTERMNKYLKISTHLRAVWPRVAIVRGTDPVWLSQVLAYSVNAEHDDAPDSAASLMRAMRLKL